MFISQPPIQHPIFANIYTLLAKIRYLYKNWPFWLFQIPSESRCEGSCNSTYGVSTIDGAILCETSMCSCCKPTHINMTQAEATCSE